MIDLFLQHWILYSIGIYFLIAFIVFLFSRDILKSIFWIFYILGDLLEGLMDGDIDFD